MFVVLQSACTAVIAISGVRVAIGLSALAEATIGIHAPASGFHQDAIRIPMMIAATLGSLINLYVVWRIRSLRARPSSQWRMQPPTQRQRRSEVFQVVLAILTLVLVAAEWITHPLVHRVP
jgi:sterol desaturase/sphingolipid hydroxylase (fatty acid hydroxylase superfamily)